MKAIINKGFDPKVILEFQARLKKMGSIFQMDEADDSNHEFACFSFIGKYKGQPVIYNTELYTLRLQHETELFEIAEHRASQHFPNYKKITYQEDEGGNLVALTNQEEEIGLFMAEVIMELEEEDQVRVKEHIEIDPEIEFGVGLEVGLHLEEITPQAIESFITRFNQQTLVLDDTLYSFQTGTEPH